MTKYLWLALAVVLCGGCAEREWTDAAVQREIAKNLRDDKYLPGVTLPQSALAEWHPPLVAKKSLAPAPILRRGEKRNGMATWRATGAGDASYNGVYVESSTHNDQPCYTNGSKWLWCAGGGTVWRLSANLDDPPVPGNGYASAGTGVLPDTPWSALSTAPAPTVAAAATPVASTEDPYNWAWPNYWLAGGAAGDNSNVAPCLATIGGVEYVVLAFNDGSDCGFYLFDRTAHTWLTLIAADLVLPNWADTLGQSSGLYDAGDGEHVWYIGNDTDDQSFVCEKYSLLGEAATRASTVTVPLPVYDARMTNLLQIADSQFRVVVRDPAGPFVYGDYYGGDVAYAELLELLTFEQDDPPPVSMTESFAHEHLYGANHRLIQTRNGETFYIRRFGSTGFPYVPTATIAYRVTPTELTRLEDDFPLPRLNGYAQSWAEYDGKLTGLWGVGSYACGAATWLPGDNAEERPTFVEYPCGRHWIIDDDGDAIVCGWGENASAGDPFVLFAAPTEVAVGKASLSLTAYAVTIAEGLSVGKATLTPTAYAVTISQVDGVNVEKATLTLTAYSPSILASITRTPGKSITEWREVRARRMPVYA